MRQPRNNSDRIVDEVAIKRCLAGTLDGRRLIQTEREHAVLALRRRGHPPKEIAQLASVSIADVGATILAYAQREPARSARLMPTT